MEQPARGLNLSDNQLLDVLHKYETAVHDEAIWNNNAKLLMLVQNAYKRQAVFYVNDPYHICDRAQCAIRNVETTVCRTGMVRRMQNFGLDEASDYTVLFVQSGERDKHGNAIVPAETLVGEIRVLHNVYVCELMATVHLCGDMCLLRERGGEVGGMRICPLTGVVLGARLVHADEWKLTNPIYHDMCNRRKRLKLLSPAVVDDGLYGSTFHVISDRVKQSLGDDRVFGKEMADAPSGSEHDEADDDDDSNASDEEFLRGDVHFSLDAISDMNRHNIIYAQNVLYVLLLSEQRQMEEADAVFEGYRTSFTVAFKSMRKFFGRQTKLAMRQRKRGGGTTTAAAAAAHEEEAAEEFEPVCVQQCIGAVYGLLARNEYFAVFPLAPPVTEHIDTELVKFGREMHHYERHFTKRFENSNISHGRHMIEKNRRTKGGGGGGPKYKRPQFKSRLNVNSIRGIYKTRSPDDGPADEADNVNIYTLYTALMEEITGYKSEGERDLKDTTDELLCNIYVISVLIVLIFGRLKRKTMSAAVRDRNIPSCLAFKRYIVPIIYLLREGLTIPHNHIIRDKVTVIPKIELLYHLPDVKRLLNYAIVRKSLLRIKNFTKLTLDIKNIYNNVANAGEILDMELTHSDIDKIFSASAKNMKK